jgi:two-component system, NarL family, nitrate/nitrite response regulator NarL
MSDKINVVIADDHTLFREGLAGIIGGTEDFEVVGQGGSMQEAVQLARDLLPDIILLDIDMPGGGLEAARVIAGELPVTRIVVLTSSEEDDHLIAALKIGARAYILKGVAARELIRILRAVWAGESYVPPMLAASLLLEMREANSQQKKTAGPLDELTPRERQILEGLAAGLSNKEIGEQLFLSEKTVKHYMTNILQKLQVRNRVEAALLAQKEMKKS